MMMHDFRDLDTDEYNALRYQFILVNEEGGDPHEKVYLDDNHQSGNPTIGIGFNLRDDNSRQQVLKAFGFDLNDPGEDQYRNRIENIINSGYTSEEQLQSGLNDVMADRAADPNIENTSHTTFAFKSEAKIKSVFNTIADSKETDELDNWLAGIPNSKERIVLLDLAYNGVLNASDKLKTAIGTGNRADAWYEIRYDTNSDEQPDSIRSGIANRRYRESDLFSLYDDKENVSEADARQVLNIFTRRRNDIRDYERDFPPTDKNAQSKSVEQCIIPAERVLIAEYASEMIPGQIELGHGHVLVGDDKDNTKSLTGSDDNDLILGGGGADVIHGGKGNDILYGEDGQDHLYGGELGDVLKGGVDDDILEGGSGSDHLYGGGGSDTYVFSTDDFYPVNPSVDVIDDSDGSGTIKIDGVDLAVGERTSYNTWESVNGEFIVIADLALDSQSLIIKNKETGSKILVKNWHNGDLGIQLGGDIPTPTVAALTADNDLFGSNGVVGLNAFGAASYYAAYTKLPSYKAPLIRFNSLGLTGDNNGDDAYAGLAGSDGLGGGAGNDTLKGGADNDLILGGSGDDRLYGGDGIDYIIDGSSDTHFVKWGDPHAVHAVGG